MKSSPTFSIVIPTFNRPYELIRSLNSVEKQTFKDYEVIVVDDGSTEKIDHEQLKGFNFKINYIQNHENLGAATARNIGIKAALGKYISFLEDDDEYCETFLEDSLNVLSENPNISITWCSVQYINNSCYVDPPEKTEVFKKKIDIFKKLLSIGIGHGVTIRSSHINKQQNFFDEKIKVVEDTDFFIRLLSKGFTPYFISGKAKVKVHNHDKIRMTSPEFNNLRVKESKILLKKYEGFFTEFPALKQQLENHIAYLEGN
ncbi:glycosyltransferase family A protein [Acinetobacter sp. XH1741]|uniref:glycosyltransferase family 2 protein n=1 Tax=unclassified Acinetobacter TaxID=196816 RepID=UPI0032B5FA62